MDETVRKISADAINPRYNWGRALPALGITGVEFEERVDFRRLDTYRLPPPQQDQGGRMGARQALPLGAAHAWRRSDPVGLRLGGGAPQALHALAQAGE